MPEITTEKPDATKRMEHRFTTDDGVELFYAEYGSRKGTPIAICHGIAVDSSQFIEDAEFLASRGYRVLTPDLRGHGRSGIAPTQRENYTLTRLARDQAQMLDHAGIDTAHWVGNSLGGMVGLSVLAFHADRLRSLTTFGTPYELRLPSPGVKPFVAINFRLWRPFVVHIAAALCSRSAKTRKRIVSMAMKANPEVLGALSQGLVGYDYRDEVANSHIPIMLLHCHQDGLIGWSMRSTLKLARQASGVRFVDLPKGGHCANLDVPDEVHQALLAFWHAA